MIGASPVRGAPGGSVRSWCDNEPVGDESNEKKFRKVYRAALASEIGPTLRALGFEGEKGGYVAPWNDELRFAVTIRESKWNKFGAAKFQVLPNVWVLETNERGVRWIWVPNPDPDEWTFDTDEAIATVGRKLVDAILRSAVPLALEALGPPLDERMAAIAAQTSPGEARTLGNGYMMTEDS